MDTTALPGPVVVDWDILPSEDESTLTEDMCELADINGGLPTYVVLKAIDNLAEHHPGHGVLLDILVGEIARVARHLVERGTSNA